MKSYLMTQIQFKQILAYAPFFVLKTAGNLTYLAIRILKSFQVWIDRATNRFSNYNY